MQKNKDIKNSRLLFLATMIPMTMVASPIVGYVLGWGIDYIFKTDFFKIIFLVLGFIAGIREIVKTLKTFQRETKDDDKE